ncbi:C4-dicarboxylate transport sensor protein DctB [compost metagenome]
MPAACVRLSGQRDGGRYQLTVADNGGGLPEQVRQHLFEPFFTTKPQGSGLGLGLTLSASLAAAANGTLQAQPLPQGAAFVLQLPLCPEQELHHV